MVNRVGHRQVNRITSALSQDQAVAMSIKNQKRLVMLLVHHIVPSCVCRPFSTKPPDECRLCLTTDDHSRNENTTRCGTIST